MRTILITLLLLSGCTEKKVIEVSGEAPPEQIQTDDPSTNDAAEVIYPCAYTKLSDEMRSPSTIAEAVALINALPKPLELSCFLRSLKRPLFLNLTDSAVSIQPSNGPESPRIFLFNQDLIMSIVTEGSGSNTLEFGQLVDGSDSIKGELKFPIETEISNTLPFDTIWRPDKGNTRCAACHGQDRFDNVTGGYQSLAIRPSSNRKVELYDLDVERYECQLADDNQGRCRIIRAVMAYGEVRDIDFPSGLPTFFEAININNNNP